MKDTILKMNEICEDWHKSNLRLFEWVSTGLPKPLEFCIKNLYHNYQIWHLIEDYTLDEREQVRFVYEGGAVHNKLRNYAAVDLDRYYSKYQSGGRWASEGIGAILDKINILTIKRLHLIDAKDSRIDSITAHLENLTVCAEELLEDMKSGARQYLVTDRFKITGEDFDKENV